MSDDIKSIIRENQPEALLAEGFDAALIGFVEGAGRDAVALYDREKCIEILMTRDGMSYSDALEYFDFNVIGAYMGEHTPLFATILREETP